MIPFLGGFHTFGQPRSERLAQRPHVWPGFRTFGQDSERLVRIRGLYKAWSSDRTFGRIPNVWPGFRTFGRIPHVWPERTCIPENTDSDIDRTIHQITKNAINQA